MSAPTRWQKSSFSSEGSSCLEIASTPHGHVRFRESDEPDVILTTSTARLQALLSLTRAQPSRWSP
jgi:hypothetical protein